MESKEQAEARGQDKYTGQQHRRSGRIDVGSSNNNLALNRKNRGC